MTWPQMWMIGWIQFVIVGLLLLMAAQVALRRLAEPVERIRVIQITLAAVLITPFLLGLAPLPTWRLALLPTRSSAPQADPGLRPISPEPEQPNVSSAPYLAELISPEPVPVDRADSGPVAHAMPPAGVGASTPAAHAAVRQENASASADPWTIAGMVVGLLHAFAFVFILVEWGVGAARLRQLCRSATAAPMSVISAWEAISAGRCRNVQLLVSPSIGTPLTFGWLHPVVVLPEDLAASNSSALRYCLSHEHSHVERRDVLAWRAAWACQFLLWYQPLFWTLRRELRICQDMLADNHSTSAGADAVEYSELLVSFARKHRTATLAGALTFLDHPSQLTRRVKMLLQHHAPLHPSCTWRFSLVAAMTAGLFAVLITSIRLDAAHNVSRNETATTSAQLRKPTIGSQPQLIAVADQAESKEKPAETGEKQAAKDERLTYHCIVVDKETGKGIPNAKVAVRRSKLTSQESTLIEESRYTTDADGKYTVEIPPEQVTERYLYIELDVEHEQYAARKGFGYALSMIRKNETLGERPFFERTELYAGEPVTGSILSPDGAPLAGVKILGYSMETGRDFRGYHSFTDTLTAADGTFRLNLLKGGDGVFWIIPRDHAIVQKFIAKQRRDMGEFRLQPGIRAGGRVLSADGKPLAGIAVNIDYRGNGDVGGLPVATSIRRGAISDAEGRFSFDPLPAGDYRVMPSEHRGDPLERDRTVRPLPGVFIGRKVTLKEGIDAPQFEIQAVPHVLFNAQFVDGKGEKTRGHVIILNGKIDGDSWLAQGRPDTEGTISLRVPHGLQDAHVQLITNEHGALRYRRSKDGPLQNEVHSIDFGTLNDDVQGFEIVRYSAPVALIAAVDEEQKPIKTFRVAGTYAWGKQRYVLEGEQRSDLSFEHQDDGRYRTSQMLPDEEVTFTVTAAGYQPASETVKLAEGANKELVLMLKTVVDDKKP